MGKIIKPALGIAGLAFGAPGGLAGLGLGLLGDKVGLWGGKKKREETVDPMAGLPGSETSARTDRAATELGQRRRMGYAKNNALAEGGKGATLGA